MKREERELVRVPVRRIPKRIVSEQEKFPPVVDREALLIPRRWRIY